jgi:hypothetical protein
MRTLGQPLCVVCQDHISQRLKAGLYFNPASCFVATAVYGDPQHADVKAIRSWRDRHLRPGDPWKMPMTALDVAYRRIGPSLADYVRTRPRLASTIRARLLEPCAAYLRRLHHDDGDGPAVIAAVDPSGRWRRLPRKLGHPRFPNR